MKEEGRRKKEEGKIQLAVGVKHLGDNYCYPFSILYPNASPGPRERLRYASPGPHDRFRSPANKQSGKIKEGKQKFFENGTRNRTNC
ncbi:MAG: hypothetical protein MUE44_33110 [Oscillatoriaceae cyanobacterium Prado104]|jgi:uncharacterized protein YjbJ (UPF0337 family)|nr:hypothetical protein [Oscillatoriaceae cyanobacterium Prado104]